MLVYPCGLDVSSLIPVLPRRSPARTPSSDWKPPAPGRRQALLVLAYLRNETAQLAAGFGIGTSMVYRYISEAVDLLAALAPILDEAVRGALLPIDRIAAARPLYSGNTTSTA